MTDKEFLDKVGYDRLVAIIKTHFAAFMTGVQAGTNVTITGDPKNPVISVSGIPIPEKFSSTDTIMDAIGTVIPGLAFANVSPLTPGAVFSSPDVVIFANGVVGQVTSYNTVTQLFDVVIIQIPIATAWSAITGTPTSNPQLKALLDALQPALTAGTGIVIAPNGTISVKIVSDSLSISTQDGGVKLEVVPISDAEIDAAWD